MHLVRLIYYSENRLDPIAGSMLDALQTILAASSRNNAARGLTGLLAFDNAWFIQALEGDRETVWDAFRRIMRDPRHDGVQLVETTAITTRTFGKWSMRLAMRTPENQSYFDPFMVDGMLQPNLMAGHEIFRLLVGSGRRLPSTTPSALPLAG